MSPSSASHPQHTGRGLWPHQRDAADTIIKTLTYRARATAVVACGFGKTRIGAQAADLLVPTGGRMMVAAPLVLLLVQTLHEHRLGARALGRVIAVCGDRRTLARFATHPELADAEVTTDPALLAALLHAPGRVSLLRQALGHSWPDAPVADAAWIRHIEQLDAFVHEHGAAAPKQSTDQALSGWLGSQIARRRRGVLDHDHAAQLAGLLGARWAQPKRRPGTGSNQRLQETDEQLREHGGALPSIGDNRGLRRWLIAQRSNHEAGRLAPERTFELERLLRSGWPAAVGARRARGERVTEPAGAAG